MKCFLLARGEVVGWIEPDVLDDGMNVVSGPFQPNENYAAIQAVVLQENEGQVHSGTPGLELCVQTEDGQALEPDGGVCLMDFSPHLEEDAIRLDIWGVKQEVFDRFWDTRSGGRLTRPGERFPRSGGRFPQPGG